MIHKKSTAAWAEIGGKRFYSRSLWERNFSRYLQFIKERGYIIEWTYEPTTFWFEDIKRGVRSYKPDFRVMQLDGTCIWYEVKGYMDAKSNTKIKRFRKYYPDEKLIVIDAKWFSENNTKMRLLIPDWEIGENTLPKFRYQAKKTI